MKKSNYPAVAQNCGDQRPGMARCAAPTTNLDRAVSPAKQNREAADHMWAAVQAHGATGSDDEQKD